MSFVTVLLHSQLQLGKAQQAIETLSKERTRLEEAHKEEITLNETNSVRVKELEQKLKASKTAIQWLQKRWLEAGNKE